MNPLPPDSFAALASSLGMRTHFVALLAFLCLLMGAFAHGFARAETGFYPRFFDQVDYRLRAAGIAAEFTEDGVAGMLRRGLSEAPAQGPVLPVLGGICYALGFDPVFGVFTLFLASLAGLWLAFATLRRSPWLGWAAVVLVLLPKSWFREVGAATDFRPDFLGQYLWTTATGLVLASRCCARTGPTLAAGIVLGIAFCGRSLTLAYAMAAAPWLVLAAWRGDGLGDRRRRLRNLACASLIAVALALPFFCTRFSVLYDYYIANHLSARENEARGFTGGFVQHLGWYLDCLRKAHLGNTATIWLLVVCGVGLLGRQHRSALPGWGLTLCGLAFLSPLLVMSMGPQYSEVVPGVVAGAVALLALIPVLREPGRLRVPAWVLVLLAAMGCLAWPLRFLADCEAGRAHRLGLGHANVRTVVDTILDAAAGPAPTVLATIPLIDSISAPMVQLAGFERNGRLGRTFVGGVGHSIYGAPDLATLLAQLRASNLVVFWDGGCSGDPGLPANQLVLQNLEPIRAALARDFVPLGAAVRLEGHPLQVFTPRPAGR